MTHALKEATPMDTVGPSVTVRFVLREDEIASAYRTLSLKRPLFWVVSLIGVYFLVQGALDLRGADVLGNASLHFAGGLFLVGMIATIVFIYPRWQFRRNARARGEQSHEFSDEGFEVSLSDSRSVAKWTFYQQVIATSDLYLMLHNNRLCNILPRRAFANPADEATFREILHRHTKLRTVGASDSRKTTESR